MIHSYAKLETTPEVIQKDLGMSPEEFDKQFFAWLDAKPRSRSTISTNGANKSKTFRKT